MTIKTPLISIIIPCYNQGMYLPATLDSVLKQSYNHWECIIVIDGSLDNSEIIAIDYRQKDARFKILKKANGGLSSARNAGIKDSKGKFIQLLDSDDLLEEDKLKFAIEIYQSSVIQDNKTIVYSGMRYFEDFKPEFLKILGRNNFIGHVELTQNDSLKSQFELIQARNLCVISAPLYPKEVFINELFDENLKALEDWDFQFRCIKNKYKFHYSNDKSSKTLIRLHNHSMMRDQKFMDENFSKFRIKHQYKTEEISKKKNIFKEALKLITPPFVIKIYNILLYK